MTTGILNGNTFGLYTIQLNIAPAAAAAASSVEQAFTIPNLRLTDAIIDVTPPSDVAGVAVVNARVTAAGSVGIKFLNPTAGSLTPPAGVYTVTVLRPAGSTGAAVAISD